MRSIRGHWKCVIIGILGLLALTTTKAHASAMYSVTDLGTLPGTTQSEAVGINASGQVVGVSYNTSPHDSDAQSFLYSSGALSAVTPLGGGPANAINDSGLIVGGNITSVNNSGDYTVDTGSAGPNLFQSGASSTNLQLLEPYHINDSGLIVGAYLPPGEAIHVGIFRNGKLSLPGEPGGGLSVNNAGDILAIVTGQQNRTVIYHSDGTSTDLSKIASGSGAMGRALNDRDQVVGIVYSSNSIPDHAFMYSSGQIFDLNSLIPQGSGWQLTQAFGINNAGQIVGQGMIDGAQHAFLLTPQAVPEPQTFVLYVVATFVGVCNLRRKRVGNP